MSTHTSAGSGLRRLPFQREREGRPPILWVRVSLQLCTSNTNRLHATQRLFSPTGGVAGDGAAWPVHEATTSRTVLWPFLKLLAIPLPFLGDLLWS